MWGSIIGVGEIVVVTALSINHNREKARELELGDAHFGKGEV